MSDSEKCNSEVWDAINHLRQMARELPDGRKCRVLVVEDDPDDSDLLRRELNKFHCECMFCNDSVEAVELINQNNFDVVMLDLMMPKLNGMEVIQKTFGMAPGTNFIIVTGADPSSPVLSAALKAGGVVSFIKPVTADKLRVLFPPKHEPPK